VGVPENCPVMPVQEQVVEVKQAEEIKPEDLSVDFEDLSVGDSERNLQKKEQMSLYSKVDHDLHFESRYKRQVNNRLSSDKGMAAF